MSIAVLFEPYTLSGLALPNRLVRAALHEKLADGDGFVTDSLLTLYEALARGNVGLIITGAALVHPSGWYLPRMISAHSDIYVEGLRRLAGAVHDSGGRVALQLAHGGPHCTRVQLGGADPLGPSDVPLPGSRSIPRAMGDSEVWEVVDAFAEAAWRTRAAGFDALEVHAAHGGLLAAFLSPYMNRRDDYWGGDEERRFHFLEEVCRAVRGAVDPGFPVIVKINAREGVEEGMDPAACARVAARLAHMGIDGVEVSGGLREHVPLADICSPGGEALFREGARLVKRAAAMPVILTGGLRTRAVMEDVLRSGDADLLGLGRPLLRQPDLPLLLAGEATRADCISCNRCTRLHKLRHVRCKQIREDAAAGRNTEQSPPFC